MAAIDMKALMREEKARMRAEMAAEMAAKSGEGGGGDGDGGGGAKAVSFASSSLSSSSSSSSSSSAAEAATGAAVDSIDFPPFDRWTSRPRVKLTDYDVDSKLKTVSYLPEWVAEDEEAAIMAQTYAVPDSHPSWVTLRGRRLQCWGGEPRRDSAAEPLPPWLQRLSEGLVEAGIFPAEVAPNHVLLNEYKAGEGIMAHTDGDFYHPQTATLSLGGTAVMTFAPRVQPGAVGLVDGRPVAEVILRPRSLVVFREEAYLDHLHAIAASHSDEVGAAAPVANLESAGARLGEVIARPAVRLSLTFRHIVRERPDGGGGVGGGDGGGGAGGGGGGGGGGDSKGERAAAAPTPAAPLTTTKQQPPKELKPQPPPQQPRYDGPKKSMKDGSDVSDSSMVALKSRGATASFTMVYFSDFYNVSFPDGIAVGAKVTFNGRIQGDTGSSVMHTAPREIVESRGTIAAVNSDSFDLDKGDEHGNKLHVLFEQCTFTPPDVKVLLERYAGDAAGTTSDAPGASDG